MIWVAVAALAGLLIGSLMNWAVDYLPRFARQPPHPKPAARLRLGFWQLIKSAVLQWSPGPTRSLWSNAAVELLTALLCALLVACYSPSWQLLLVATAITLFLLVALIDLKYRLVLDALVYPAGIAALVLHLLLPDGRFLLALLGGGFGFFTFFLTALLRPQGLGGGDVKLAALVGLVTGFPEVLWALAVGIVSGGIAALILVLIVRQDAQSTMPYAPFLCLGAIVALIYNPLPLFFPS